MNSNEILIAIDEIAATASKNEKQALVTKYAADPEFCRVLEYAYNPFKKYGIRQIPERTAHGDDEFDAGIWTMLDELIARELTGDAARVTLQLALERLSKQSSDLLVRIIRGDLRAGFSESTINKAKKGLIPDFPYMRCSLPKDAKLAEWPWADGVISQEKADGMFANVDHEANGLVAIRSRQGSEFPIEAFADLVADVRARLAPGHQYHGEIVVMRDGVVLDREIGNGIINSVLNGGDFGPDERPFYFIWDQIPLSAVVTKGKYEVPQVVRLNSIIKQLKTGPGTSVGLIPTRIVRSLGEAYAHAGELMRQGKEGTVIKHPKAIWRDGTSKEQIKLKLEFEVDLEILEVMPGTPGTKTEGRAGALRCGTSCRGLLVNVAIKNEAMRDAVDAWPDTWIGRIIPVTANDIMAPSESNDLHSLFLPRMAEAAYRRDKTTADSLERVKAQKEAAVFGKKLKEAA